jgi:hypothetical protein
VRGGFLNRKGFQGTTVSNDDKRGIQHRWES